MYPLLTALFWTKRTPSPAKRLAGMAGILLLLSSSHSRAADGVTAGELILERPTLISLGFEWRIEGDENGNCRATVHFRKAGEEAWREFLPLFRIGRGLQVSHSMACGWPYYLIPDAVAGSIFDLEPGTEYDVRLELVDPDGVEGEGVRELRMRTRREPVVPANPKAVRHVYPPDWEGEKEEPHYRNVMEAVNGYAPLTDVYLTLRPPMAAKPGTVVKMHAGVHTYDNNLYWKNRKPAHSYWMHGTITLVAKGTPESPIYIVAAGDGKVILDGNGCHNLFNLRSTDYLHFEGLTIRNTEIAFHGGFQGLRGGGMKGLTVKNCRIENVVYGVLAQDGRSSDFYIADNVITGRNNPEALGNFGRSESGYAVNLAGQGHVVCHNYAAHFWDGINVFTGSISDPEYGQQSRSIDIYNNILHNCTDQFLEADGGYANIRILRNRCFNCPSQPVSNQPVFAGPVYWIRNIVWNACGGRTMMKEHGEVQAYVFAHNTSSTQLRMPFEDQKTERDSWLVANNASIGPQRENLPIVELFPGKAGPDRIVAHNAYREPLATQAWLCGETAYPSLDALRSATGFEAGSVLVSGYEVFEDAPEPPHTNREAGLVPPMSVDLRPRAGSALIDAARRLPGINDDYTGEGPDIGALEAGRPVPQYGPRTQPVACE